MEVVDAVDVVDVIVVVDEMVVLREKYKPTPTTRINITRITAILILLMAILGVLLNFKFVLRLQVITAQLTQITLIV